MESERLNFIRFNQDKLRVEQYTHLRDALANEGDPGNVGHISIMLSSFTTNSKRYLTEYTQDGMTYVQVYGQPDIFLTMTAKQGWPEMKEAIFPGQSHSDRHDVMARVFRRKVVKLMELIRKGEIFGPVSCLSQLPVQYLTTAKSHVFLQGEALPIQHRVAEAQLAPPSFLGLAYKQDSP